LLHYQETNMSDPFDESLDGFSAAVDAAIKPEDKATIAAHNDHLHRMFAYSDVRRNLFKNDVQDVSKPENHRTAVVSLAKVFDETFRHWDALPDGPVKDNIAYTYASVHRASKEIQQLQEQLEIAATLLQLMGRNKPKDPIGFDTNKTET